MNEKCPSCGKLLHWTLVGAIMKKERVIVCTFCSKSSPIELFIPDILESPRYKSVEGR